MYIILFIFRNHIELKNNIYSLVKTLVILYILKKNKSFNFTFTNFNLLHEKIELIYM